MARGAAEAALNVVEDFVDAGFEFMDGGFPGAAAQAPAPPGAPVEPRAHGQEEAEAEDRPAPARTRYDHPPIAGFAVVGGVLVSVVAAEDVVRILLPQWSD